MFKDKGRSNHTDLGQEYVKDMLTWKGKIWKLRSERSSEHCIAIKGANVSIIS
jgi:hypothetical protein